MNISLMILVGINALILIMFWLWLTGWRKVSGDSDGTVTENGFRRLMQRVDGVWKDELSTDHIRKIELEIEEEQRELFDKAIEEEQTIKSAITDEDSVEIRQIKKRHEKLRGYQLSIDRLTAVRKRLHRKRQRRHVWLGLNNMLGEYPALALEWTVLVLIIVVLALLFVELGFGYEKLDSIKFDVLNQTISVLWAFYIVDVFACTIFVIEFFLRLSVADDRKWFWRHNWIDLASSIPVPPISPEAHLNIVLRFLRLLRLMRLFRVARILDILWNGMERLERNADINLIIKSAGTLVVLLILGTSAVTIVEPVGSSAGEETQKLKFVSEVDGIPIVLYANIDASEQVRENPKDADLDSVTLGRFSETLWWTFNAIAPNAGYADLHVPKQNFTRLVTALLLLWGAVVMGAFVATLTASFNGERTEELRLKQLELSAELLEVRKTQEEFKRQFGDHPTYGPWDRP